MKTTWRQRQAAATRRQIVEAARVLFGRDGYANTTIEAIAAEAGVAVPTVYKAFGNKRSIARELNDLIDERAGVAQVAAQALASDDPLRVIALSVQIGRSLHESCGDIIEAMDAAAAAEPELASVTAEGRRRHVAGMRGAASRLQALGALRPGVDVEHAAGLLGQLTSTETFATLTHDYAWTVDECERRLNAAARQLLLD